MQKLILLTFLTTLPLTSGWPQKPPQEKYKCALCGNTFDRDMSHQPACPGADSAPRHHDCRKVEVK